MAFMTVGYECLMHINKLIFIYRKAGEYNYINFTTGNRELQGFAKGRTRILQQNQDYNAFSKDEIPHSLTARSGWLLIPSLVQLKKKLTSLPGSQMSERGDELERHEKLAKSGEQNVVPFQREHSFRFVKWLRNDSKS